MEPTAQTQQWDRKNVNCREEAGSLKSQRDPRSYIKIGFSALNQFCFCFSLSLSLSLLLNWIGNVSQPWRPHTQPITSISLRSIKSMNRLIETIHTFTLASLVLPLSLFPALDRIEWQDFGLLYIKVGTCWGLPFMTPTECWDFFTPSPLFVHKIYTFVGNLGIFWPPSPSCADADVMHGIPLESPSDSRKV